MAELHVLTGDGGEQTVPLGDAPVTFGRDHDCDVVMSEPQASRRHCTFYPPAASSGPGSSAGWRVVDLGSSNGTHLGGKPVRSARLQPGDELEIGQTVITYVAEAAEPVRQRLVVEKKPAWGMLVVPIVFGVAAWLGLGAYDSASAAERDRTWESAARSVVERTELSTQRDRRSEILESFLASLPTEPEAPQARAVINAAIRAGAEPAAGVDGGPDARWRAPLAEIRSSWDQMSPVQLRSRLRKLLDRHGDDPAMLSEVRALLERLSREAVTRAASDRERTSSEARRAMDEGRLASALDLWHGWLLRAPALDRAQEREVARHLDSIVAKARALAEQTLAQAETLEKEGRKDAAAEKVASALQSLRGSGYDAWLVARTADFTAEGPTGTVALDVVRKSDSSTRERQSALRAMAAAEGLARLRRFSDAAKRLEQALPTVSDATLRSDLEGRLGTLREEAAVLIQLLAQVRERPAAFGPLRLSDGVWKVTGATPDALLLARRDESVMRTLLELPAEAAAFLFRKAKLSPEQERAAAVVLWDIGDRDGYVEFMRRALGTEDDTVRLAASFVHAQLQGREMPGAGFVPHPDRDGGVITWDEFQEILNSEKIAEYTAQLEKLVAGVEGSKQAKQVERVRRVYAKLEDARDFALELIFDEVAYFYPYRDRMKEYMPVKLEVDRRVKLVEEVWESSAKSSVTSDAKIEGTLEKIEDLRIEINYLGGPTDEFEARLAAVTMYVGHNLSVRTFFENESDLKLHAYNAEVMAENAVADSVATKDERRQVEITNEYRIMMGHRRAVIINDELTLAARGHSADMSRLGFFDHFSPVPGKRAPADRIRAAGYSFSGCSENIHRGSGDPMGAHLSWRGSSGHHRNLLMPSWVEMGTGRDGRNWTQNFGFQGGRPEDDF